MTVQDHHVHFADGTLSQRQIKEEVDPTLYDTGPARSETENLEVSYKSDFLVRGINVYELNNNRHK